MKKLHVMQEKLSTVPERPGVYVFKDRKNRILYVGKAKELKARLRSYFQKSSGLDLRKTAMVRGISDFEYTVTDNELEALVLEANLIKQYKPRYNIILRDDKNYPYLKLTVNERWPRIQVVRRIQKDGAKYFGPYVPSGPMWETLSFIRNIFHIPTCKYSFKKQMRPCIDYQIKKCSAPCAGLVNRNEYLGIINELKLMLEGKNRRLLDSLEKRMGRLSEEMRYEEAALLRDRIKAIKKIAESQKAVAPGLGDVDVIGLFRKENIVIFKIFFSRNGIMIGSKDFRLRDISGETDGYLMKNFIGQFYEKEIIPPPELLCSHIPEDSMILSSWLSGKKDTKVIPVRKKHRFSNRVKISVPKKGIKRKLVEMAEENARILFKGEADSDRKTMMKEITAKLNLHKIPKDIGAFDISNILGREAVGSFVYWSDGDFRKEKYRHIKMETVKGPDDYSMIKEMVRRVIKNLRKDMPDLIIIDGGKGQLESALEVFRENRITNKEIIAIAKDPDRVFLTNEKYPVTIEDRRASSLLLKRIRDEAHRFAISYHRKLRSKRVFESSLEKIPGIGKKRRFELLRHFSSIEAVKHATVDEISALKGFNRKIAEKVLIFLKKNEKG